MPRFFHSSAVLVLAALAACQADKSTSPPKPAAIQIVAGDAQLGAAGQQLQIAPTFVVNDETGHAMTGVSVAIAVASGNGSLATAAIKTLATSATPVGMWTLGPKTGANQLTITVAGLTPMTVSATAIAGAAAKIVASPTVVYTARAGELVSPAPSARVTDAFDNPIASAVVSLTTIGGSAAASAVADAQGVITSPAWTAGTAAGQNTLTLTSGTATTSFIATVRAADPAQLVVLAGDAQRGQAGVAVPAPVTLRIVDRFGNGVGAQPATVAVTHGGGVLSATTAIAGADGIITVPSWTLGRTTLPQSLHITSGAFGADVSASVQSDYHIDVRFYGPEMTDAQRALFTNAAARISAIVTGDIADVRATNLNVANACGMAGLPVVNETIDDLVIYASVQDIDGPRGILAQAGPCVFRGQSAGYLTAVGVMEFDSADIQTMDPEMLQGVITHEMLHLLGVGTLWSSQALLQGAGQPGVAYLGLRGRQGCADDGGNAVCASGVPVENNGVAGTADAHWRESVFKNELMTGYANSGGMPLSAITVGNLADMGYAVNPFAADPFQVPVGGALGDARPGALPAGWEASLPGGGVILTPTGGATAVKRPH